jgi:pimeloyl-ACP methyl ester carboxylesterase
MHCMKAWSGCARLLMLTLLCSLSARAQNVNSYLFDYDKTEPLRWKSDRIQDTANCTVDEASFRVAEDHVADLLIISKPDNTLSRKPVIIFQHWGGGNKTFFKKEAVAFAEKGFLCISLNAPWHWKTLADTASFFNTYPKFIRLSVIAIRRLIDSLSRNQGIDRRNIYYIGHSYGATLGGLLAGIEPRIKGGVLMAGLPNISKFMMEEKQGVWKKNWDADTVRFMQVANELSAMEPENSIVKTKWKIYHQVAEKDEVVKPEQSDRFMNKTPKPFKSSSYPAGHLFNEQAMEDRISWILQLYQPRAFISGQP